MRGALARRHPPARSPAPRARTGCCLLVRSPRLDRRRALEKKTADTSCGPRRGAAAERPPGHARGHCLTTSVRRADARIAVEPRRGGKLAGPPRPYTAIPTSQPSLAEQRAWRSLAAAVDGPGRSADAADERDRGRMQLPATIEAPAGQVWMRVCDRHPSGDAPRGRARASPSMCSVDDAARRRSLAGARPRPPIL